jgi:hypothetical protein
MNQKEAVYTAITEVMGTNEFDGPVKLERGEEREKVTQRVEELFKNGEVQFTRGEERDGKELRRYVVGLISNWLRKDSRLNGNTQYQPKNPGSRAGGKDEQMSAMRALLAATHEPKARAEIQQAIDERAKELKQQSAKPINVEALPEHLRKYATEH